MQPFSFFYEMYYRQIICVYLRKAKAARSPRLAY